MKHYIFRLRGEIVFECNARDVKAADIFLQWKTWLTLNDPEVTCEELCLLEHQ